MSTMSQSRAWTGAPVFSYGFRPFFLAGSLYSAIVMALWVPWYLGAIVLPVAFDPVTWHVHELLFGYVLAIVAGFLLTAVPNWTGRLPVVGYPLIGLFALWLIGRIAIAVSAWLDPVALVLLSLAFPIVLLFMMTREVIVGNNTKNLIVVAVISIVVLAQGMMQFMHATGQETSVAARLGVAGVVMLIMIIGGRITPSFTRNWIKKSNPGREPAPIGWFDFLALIVGVVSLLIWVSAKVLPDSLKLAAAALLLMAGGVHLIRQSRWAPDRVLSEPILLVLHIGYVFVPAGFMLSGLALVDGVGVSALAGMHAWTAGAVGVMTLAVMTRATLGHTGRDLTASRGTVTVYALVTGAALARIASVLVSDYTVVLIGASAIAWCLAFIGFTVIYGPMLVSKRT